MNGTALVRVWDPLVRVGHWALVAGFTVAYLTEDDLLDVHVWTGYAVGALLVVRLVWGFVGSRHARFSDFVTGPAKGFAYLRDLMLFRAKRYKGHSPAGGAMVIALLLCLAATVITGLMVYGEEKHAGPLAPLYAHGHSIGVAAVSPAAADEDKRRPSGKKVENGALEGAHEFFANLTLILIGFHIGGVLLASLVHRENLIAAMFTGYKRPV